MRAIKEYIYNSAPQTIAAFNRVRRVFNRTHSKQLKLGFVVEEFFHEELRGFGGYGMLVKNLAEEFNTNPNGFQVDVFLASMLNGRECEVSKYHDTDVYFRPGHTDNYLFNYLKYGLMVNKKSPDLLVSVDWYQSYEYVIDSMPQTPLLVWIQDPRSKKEWKNISTVPMEAKLIGDEHGKIDVEKIFQRKHDSFQRLFELSEKNGRKLLFGTQAKCLVKRAMKAYGVPNLEAEFLPNVIDIPDVKQPQFSERPSLCLLGRLDPVKRPWIYFELAKRFPQVDFLVAGNAHNAELMDPIIDRYKGVPNLRFLGHVDGQQKQNLLNSVWALVNTSIHEALPVTFLEAFAYGKPVISCQNPDNLVSDYGYWTGECLGDGLDEKNLTRYSEEIEKLLSDKTLRNHKGIAGYEYVRNNHSLENFKKRLNKILEK